MIELANIATQSRGISGFRRGACSLKLHRLAHHVSLLLIVLGTKCHMLLMMQSLTVDRRDLDHDVMVLGHHYRISGIRDRISGHKY